MPSPQRPSIDRVPTPYGRRFRPQAPTRRATVTAVLLGAVFSVAGCHPLSQSDQVALDRWLECVECNQGELTAVLARGALVLPPLRQVLLQGPDSTKLRVLEDYLAQRAQRIQDSVPLPPIHPPPHHGQLNADAQLYVDTFLSNYTAVVERRAALALAKIGGPEAKVALQQASALNLRSDVHDFVVYARDSLWVP